MNNKIYEHNFCTQPGSLEDSCFYGRDEYINVIHKYIDESKHCVMSYAMLNQNELICIMQ